MATPVFCCGFECGVANAHWALTGNTSFSTSTVRSGARSARIAPTASTTGQITRVISTNKIVLRAYLRFAVLPDQTHIIIGATDGSDNAGVVFNVSDSKLYAGSSSGLKGATGISITTGVWYRIDIYLDVSANPWVNKVKVDGVDCGDYNRATAATTLTSILLGYATAANARTFDAFFDDIIVSETLADYPIGAGHVNHFVPTADGTHNVIGASDFERSGTGTDITNATTTAYQLIDDVPLKSGVVSEYINLIAPPNATDYVEVVFGPAPGISTPTAAPRAVEALVAYASTSAGTNNLRLALNDNGTTNDVLNTTTGPGTTATYARKFYAAGPAGAWVIGGGGNGDFTDLRMRCFTSDAAPDPWWASAMIEAEFQEIAVIPNKIVQVNQAIKRASYY